MKKEIEYGRRVSLRLPDELADEIDAFTKERGMSFTEFLRRASREKLDRDSGTGTNKHNEMIKQAVYEVLKEMGYKDKRDDA
ncbi:MAG: ribbon-helix-helix domain-containing protein [Methanocorpusculum sp.]|nr:ribbon-helix-helix domain-containing protein [Methanocorpusculum sp.]MDE2523145.1 ribbon-helix-helix domain-containing protein [Methanocorpusculum sp.]